ncbi:MAG TPA: hypothetical protein VGK34_00640, partial [Armatimonadota bacterium]
PGLIVGMIEGSYCIFLIMQGTGLDPTYILRLDDYASTASAFVFPLVFAEMSGRGVLLLRHSLAKRRLPV